MSKSSQTVSFANFNLRFGSKLALLDLWSEVVYPSFFNPLKRTTKSGTFYLAEIDLIPTNNDLLIVGRLIKDTVLSREKIYENGQLVSAKAAMEAAFSARFALRLSTHSLIWAPERKGAPSIASFQAILIKSLRHNWKIFIDKKIALDYPNAKRLDLKDLRKKLVEQFPVPVLDVISYPNRQSVGEFLGKIELLTEITYRIVEPNPHYDGKDTASALLGLKHEILAQSANLKFQDSKGLNREAAASQISNLNSTGIIESKVKGKGPHGEDLTGDSEAMQIKVHIDPLPESNAEAGLVLNERLREQEKLDLLKVGQVTKNVKRILSGIIRGITTSKN